MIAEFFLKIFDFFLSFLPTLSVPSGLSSAISWLTSVAGYINIFVPLSGVVPVIAFIIILRNWNVILAIFKFVLRFIPIFDGGD